MIKLTALSIGLILLTFAHKKKHYLTFLLILEMLRIIILLTYLQLGREIFYVLLLICISACEGAVGLSALIGSTRDKTPIITV